MFNFSSKNNSATGLSSALAKRTRRIFHPKEERLRQKQMGNACTTTKIHTAEPLEQPEDNQVTRLKTQFNLQPHPEGGFYAETYRSTEMVATPRGDRSASTAIYFLLPKNTVSKLHRIKSDEVWHFYGGGPLTIVELDETVPGMYTSTVLGNPLTQEGAVPQYVVKAGQWFAAFPHDDSQYSFVGCTVAPGFDFDDFKMGTRSKLSAEYPEAKAMILHLAIADPEPPLQI